jgi:RNA polymerase Rpb3/Rpb11 dimerisation domain.
MSSIDIKIKELEYVKQHKFTSSSLKLELEGKDMDAIIANTLRRVSYDDVPTYAFAYINIEYNDSIAFNNDYMKLRLRQLPIFNVSNDIDFLDSKYWKNVDYMNKNREKHEKEMLIEATINHYNTKNEIYNVTTKDMYYYINGVQVTYPDPYPEEPILLIQLLPNQTFKCQMRACLGVGEADSIWFASNDSYYEYNDENPNKVILTLESSGQMSEYEILVKCCRVIQVKLNAIQKHVKDRVDAKDIKPSSTLHIRLDGEDHTMGNLINNALQNNKHIAASGLSKPDHFIRSVLFKISSTNDVESPIGPFFEVIKYLKNVFSYLENQFTKLGKLKPRPSIS